MTLTEVVLAAFFLGLAGSTHCLGMCGAISANLSFSLPAAERTTRRLLYWHLVVNSGRVTFYSVLGAFAGGAGAALDQRSPMLGKAIMLLSALVLALIALQLFGQARGLQWLESLGAVVWRKVQPLTRPLLPLRKAWQAYLLGMLWGLMPCGLIYSAAALAAGAGSAIKGALLMAVFGALTAIPVAGTGVLAGSLRWLRRPGWKVLAAALCLGLALAIVWQAVSGGHGSEHGGHGTPVMQAAPHSHHAH